MFWCLSKICLVLAIVAAASAEDRESSALNKGQQRDIANGNDNVPIIASKDDDTVKKSLSNDGSLVIGLPGWNLFKQTTTTRPTRRRPHRPQYENSEEDYEYHTTRRPKTTKRPHDDDDDHGHWYGPPGYGPPWGYPYPYPRPNPTESTSTSSTTSTSTSTSTTSTTEPPARRQTQPHHYPSYYPNYPAHDYPRPSYDYPHLPYYPAPPFYPPYYYSYPLAQRLRRRPHRPRPQPDSDDEDKEDQDTDLHIDPLAVNPHYRIYGIVKPIPKDTDSNYSGEEQD